MKELTDQSTNLYDKPRKRTGMGGLADARVLRAPVVEKPSKTPSPDDKGANILSIEHQISVATELAKGKVVDKCVTFGLVEGRNTIVNTCPLLSLTEGCSKTLVMHEEGVSCPEGNGLLRIQSETISSYSLPVLQPKIEMGEVIELIERKIA